MIERRRREYLDDAEATPRPHSRAARGFAVSVLATTGAMLGLGLLMGMNAGPDPSRLAAPGLTAFRSAGALAPVFTTPSRLARVTPKPFAGLRPRHYVAALAGVQRPAPSHQPFYLEADPWRLTADGTWVAAVRARYQNAAGETESKPRAVVDFSASNGETLELDPWIDQDPAMAITLAQSDEVTVNASSVMPDAGSASVTLPAPPASAASFAAVAKAIGPHLVSVGWSPLAATENVAEYRVYRRHPGGTRALIAVVSSGGHAWRDASVTPSVAYEYSVVAQLAAGSAVAVADPLQTPDEMPSTSLDAASGKGMFLFFSPDTNDPNTYTRFDPDEVVARAAKAGVGEIELRMSRGTFFEAASGQSQAWLDRMIDAAAGAGIKLLAWSVPRRSTADDVAESVMLARYRTAAGNGFAGLALDLEPGDRYMGHGALAGDRMAAYMQLARQAVGPDYLLIATVMSPRLTHWTNDDYPYSRIARYASALQPMEYWHHYRGASHHEYAQTDVAGHCADVVALTQSLAGRQVPVNVAGQSADLGSTGKPSADELGWCLGAAKSAGAIGETFFNWQGTTSDQWAAIEAYRW